MKREYRLIKAFGLNEYGLADLPIKASGTTISRIVVGEETGCSFCFPMATKLSIVILATDKEVGKNSGENNGSEKYIVYM